jgi:hypothetical protein
MKMLTQGRRPKANENKKKGPTRARNSIRLNVSCSVNRKEISTCSNGEFVLLLVWPAERVVRDLARQNVRFGRRHADTVTSTACARRGGSKA